MSKGATMLAVVLSLAGAGTARAAESQATCAAEIQQFCKDVQSGDGRILDCLAKHSDQLSETCRIHVNTAQLYRACLDDVVRLCPTAEPAPGQGILCLRTHMNDVSTACKNELRRMKR